METKLIRNDFDWLLVVKFEPFFVPPILLPQPRHDSQRGCRRHSKTHAFFDVSELLVQLKDVVEVDIVGCGLLHVLEREQDVELLVGLRVEEEGRLSAQWAEAQS